jgi:hypothetical protein
MVPMETGYQKFVLYPKAKEVLDGSGLGERIEQLLAGEKDKTLFTESVFFDDVEQRLQMIITRGYLEAVPKDAKEQYVRVIDRMIEFGNVRIGVIDGKVERRRIEQDLSWAIETPNGTLKHAEFDNAEVLVHSGYYASLILSTQEFSDPRRFGFGSFSEMNGLIGIYMRQRSGSNIVDGYEFKDKVQGFFVAPKYPDEHIFKGDFAQFPTKDPFGNNVPYRPMMRHEARIKE